MMISTTATRATSVVDPSAGTLYVADNELLHGVGHVIRLISIAPNVRIGPIVANLIIPGSYTNGYSDEDYLTSEQFHAANGRTIGNPSVLISGTGNNGGGQGALAGVIDATTFEKLWIDIFHGPLSTAESEALASDTDESDTGCDYIVGYYVTLTSGQRGTEAFIEKVEHTGVLRWRRAWQGLGLGRNAFTSVAADDAGGAYAVGCEDDATAYESAVVVHYDADGSVAWQHRMADPGDSSSSAVSVKYNGIDTVYVLTSSFLSGPGIATFNGETGERSRRLLTSPVSTQNPVGMTVVSDSPKGTRGDRVYFWGSDILSQNAPFVYKLTYTGVILWGGDVALPYNAPCSQGAVSSKGEVALAGGLYVSSAESRFFTTVLKPDGSLKFTATYRNPRFPHVQAQGVVFDEPFNAVVTTGCDPTTGSPAIVIGYGNS